MAKTKLPFGIQHFGELRRKGCRYVDKTGFAQRLVDGGKWYFLSRPRRFGKSLFVDTLKELFEGNEELFRGLAIHDAWDWNKRHPVLHLDFSAGNYTKKKGIKNRIVDILDDFDKDNGISTAALSSGSRFARVIRRLKEKTGHSVVVLVDEYDMPILAALNRPKLAERNRNTLHSFYSALKMESDNIEFCFITGISMFAQVGLFSGLNQLENISMDSEFSEICGYTESDLDTVFSAEIEGADREKVRDWYNGYCWPGSSRLYNPHGILRFLKNQEYREWWYETGTPTFLVKVMKQREEFPIVLEGMEIAGGDLIASEIEEISTASLLFQTGYMTMVDSYFDEEGTSFRLDYPNREVRKALNRSLLSSMNPKNISTIASNSRKLENALMTGNLKKLKLVVRSMLSGVPHQWHTKPGAAQYESYFASVVYAYFLGLGLDVRVEDSTGEGRIDLVVKHKSNVYLFEFKVVNDKPTGQAMKQLQKKRYADKYRSGHTTITLVAVEFSKKSKNVVGFNWKKA